VHEQHDIPTRHEGWDAAPHHPRHASMAAECNRAPTASTPLEPRWTRSWSTHALVATGLACFLGGALAWHVIGFWSFVSDIVYNPDGTETAISVPSSASQATPKRAKDRKTTAAATPALARSSKPETTITGAQRPPVNAETLADLLQCAEAHKTEGNAHVHACPPLRKRLPIAADSSRGNRQLDAREASRRLARGWKTGVAPIETGSLPNRR
jgi:hypothetical protein